MNNKTKWGWLTIFRLAPHAPPDTRQINTHPLGEHNQTAIPNDLLVALEIVAPLGSIVTVTRIATNRIIFKNEIVPYPTGRTGCVIPLSRILTFKGEIVPGRLLLTLDATHADKEAMDLFEPISWWERLCAKILHWFDWDWAKRPLIKHHEIEFYLPPREVIRDIDAIVFGSTTIKPGFDDSLHVYLCRLAAVGTTSDLCKIRMMLGVDGTPMYNTPKGWRALFQGETVLVASHTAQCKVGFIVMKNYPGIGTALCPVFWIL